MQTRELFAHMFKIELELSMNVKTEFSSRVLFKLGHLLPIS